jgi:plastocyanin
VKKYIASAFISATGIAIVSLGLGIFYMPLQYDQNVFGAYNSPTSSPATQSSDQSSASSSTSTGKMNGNSSIALSVAEVGEVYRWTNATSGVENPELNLKVNDNNTIQIQNPTDTKHELVIDSQGKEAATSGDIAPGASGQVSFRPNGTGLFSYHCEYHPDTMKGTIKLVNP